MSVLEHDNKKTGCVFNIQQYSVHDGPGIRTTVFLKGCPLSCRWCCNPESMQSSPELAYNQSKCIGVEECSRCKTACSFGAIEEGEGGKITINREACQKCFSCEGMCPSTAMHTFGKQMSVPEVLEVVEEDSAFYSRSGGGLTISGGEPLMQADFAVALLKEAKRRRINTTIETCGYADWSKLKEVAQHLKTIIFDIKSMDAAKHKEFTGVSNDLILSNFINLREAFPHLDIWVRTPLIPGFNDSEEDIGQILGLIKGMPNIKYELLPYHPMGQSKYRFLGRDYPMGEQKLSDEKFKSLRDFAQHTLMDEKNAS